MNCSDALARQLRGFSLESTLRERPIAILPGQYFDAETGLHQNWHRDYDPGLGRYLQSDPIGLQGDLSTYGYAKQSPVRFTDPTGLFTGNVHNEITRAAMSLAGGSACGRLPELVAGADWVAGSQAPENSPWHAMRDGTNPDATADSARREYEDFINQQWKECSCDGLARALHALQDSFSRGHSGFQPWGGGLPSASHAYHDLYPTLDERSRAERASAELIRTQRKECNNQCPIP